MSRPEYGTEQPDSYTIAESILFSALNIGVGYVAAFLTRSLCGATTDLTRFRRLATFSWIALVSAGIEAAVGEVCTIEDPLPGTMIGDWLQWTLCDGLGLLLGTPAILLVIKSIGSNGRPVPSRSSAWFSCF